MKKRWPRSEAHSPMFASPGGGCTDRRVWAEWLVRLWRLGQSSRCRYLTCSPNNRGAHGAAIDHRHEVAVLMSKVAPVSSHLLTLTIDRHEFELEPRTKAGAVGGVAIRPAELWREVLGRPTNKLWDSFEVEPPRPDVDSMATGAPPTWLTKATPTNNHCRSTRRSPKAITSRSVRIGDDMWFPFPPKRRGRSH